MSVSTPTNDPHLALLHVYAQRSRRARAYILGTHIGLRSLANAITEALQSPTGHAHAVVLTGSGEGYGIEVLLHEQNPAWTQIALPYTAEYAAEDRPEALWPWNLIADDDPQDN